MKTSTIGKYKEKNKEEALKFLIGAATTTVDLSIATDLMKEAFLFYVSKCDWLEDGEDRSDIHLHYTDIRNLLEAAIEYKEATERRSATTPAIETYGNH